MRTIVMLPLSLVLGCGCSKSSPPQATMTTEAKAGVQFELRIAESSAFVTSADISACGSDRDAATGQATVRCTLTPTGATKATRAMTANVGKVMEIVVNGEVKSRPTIMEPFTGDTFSIVIGNDDAAEAEAKHLASSLAP